MKRRNREVNIFNMSLLDILCGALGAFCFMMLSLLPYYRPPGKDISVSKEQKELLDELQKIKDLAERLKSASTAEDLTELVAQLRKEIALLENEIKKLQGQVNALYAENDELKSRVAKLEVENGILRTRNEKLEKENQQLTSEKQQLLAEKQQLQREKQQLELQKRQLEIHLEERRAWTITVSASDTRYPLDCSLHEQRIMADDGTRQRDFDPDLPVQPVKWNGDFRLGGTGSVTRVNVSRFVGGEGNFYVKVNAVFGRNIGVQMQTTVDGDNLAPLTVPQVSIPPDRSWVFVGKFRVEALNRITFTAATPEEREQEWQRLEKPPEPKKPDPTPVPGNLNDSVMGPGFEKRKREYENMTGGNAPKGLHMALLTKWQAEAQSDRERNYVGSLLARMSGARDGPGPFPLPSNDPKDAAATKRKVEYTKAFHEAKSQDEKVTILRKWMMEADNDRERDRVRMMLQQTSGAPGPVPQPSSDRQRAIDEFKKKEQSPP